MKKQIRRVNYFFNDKSPRERNPPQGVCSATLGGYKDLWPNVGHFLKGEDDLDQDSKRSRTSSY